MNKNMPKVYCLQLLYRKSQALREMLHGNVKVGARLLILVRIPVDRVPPAYGIHENQMKSPPFEKGEISDLFIPSKEGRPMDKKVTIVGAGNVGATAAQRIVEKELADAVLIDIVEGLPQGKALDLVEAAPIENHDASTAGANSYELSSGSDIIIVTAGIPRKPGMSRDDLLSTNANIVGAVVEQVAPLSPEATLIIVSNPLDAMCHVALEKSGFPKNRVLGMAGVLDSARFRAFIAMELHVSVENTHAFVMGGHGDTMVPLPRYSTVAGIPITELLPPERVGALVERTRNGGAEIVSLLKTGSAYYAPASGAVEMAEAILKDKKKILPCATYLEGEYGIQGLFIGVPVKLGAAGVEEIIQIDLTEKEQEALQRSARAVGELVEAMTKMGIYSKS
jgi:malate dehydrogenase